MSSPEFSVVNVKPFKRVIGVNGKKAWLSYMKKRLEVVATWQMHGTDGKTDLHLLQKN